MKINALMLMGIIIGYIFIVLAALTMLGDYYGQSVKQNVGRVIDFSVIKDKLCNWLEDNWDHKFILWEKDPWTVTFQEIDPEGLVIVDFNPTAENMAEYLVNVIAPIQLRDTGVKLIKCDIEETRKCSASYAI